jgi:hypothetical protein
VDGHDPEFIIDHGFFQILTHLLKSFGGFHFEKHDLLLLFEGESGYHLERPSASVIPGLTRNPVFSRHPAPPFPRGDSVETFCKGLI